MFFILSKTISTLSVPSHLITLMALAGLILLATRLARTGRCLLTASFILVVILGMMPVGQAMLLVLEQRFPPWLGTGEPTGIIVLGGAIDTGASAARGMLVITEAAERLTEVALLARRFPNARIVFTGGNAELLGGQPPESAFILDLWESFGIPRARVTLEERSRNTHENAVFTTELIGPKPGDRWLLVTSALHMPRAVGSFRKAGLPVEAYPVDWRTREWDDIWWDPPWPLDGINAADRAAKEWVGLVAYWLAGYTSEFLPGARLALKPDPEMVGGNQ